MRIFITVSKKGNSINSILYVGLDFWEAVRKCMAYNFNIVLEYNEFNEHIATYDCNSDPI